MHVQSLIETQSYLRALEQRLDALEKRSDAGSVSGPLPRSPNEDTGEPKQAQALIGPRGKLRA